MRPAFIVLALLMAAPPASAAVKPGRKAPPLMRVLVASDGGTTPIVVTWRTRAALRPNQSYRVDLVTNGFPERGGPPCAAGHFVRTAGRGAPRGRRLTVRFPVPAPGRWCGSHGAGVNLYVGGGTFPVGAGAAPIADSRGILPRPGDWARTTFAAGSSVTVKVPGRADRTAPLTASIEQDTPGPSWADPSRLTNSSGTLTVGALPADPLCTAAPIAPIDVDTATTAIFGRTRADGNADAALTLVLRASPAALTGCAPETPAPALTAVSLIGIVGPGVPGVNAGVPLKGTLDGVRLAGGAVASVVFDVRMKQEFPLPSNVYP